jgi:hypothetical protein
VNNYVHNQLDNFNIFILPEVDALDAIRKRVEELIDFYDRISDDQPLDLDKVWDAGLGAPKSYVKLGKDLQSPFVSQSPNSYFT